MKDTKTPEPEFFLKNELIYFLKKNAKIHCVVSNPLPGDGGRLLLELTICGESIANHATVIPKDPNIEVELKQAKADIANLIHHLLEQQKRLDALEGKPAQQYIAVDPMKQVYGPGSSTKDLPF